ncbi:MAG: hypothetical protein LBK60_03385, partial [Verrucomicrobiales bacterium]|nr:hypothetical protein [Verrucomicrobiales bacterium]
MKIKYILQLVGAGFLLALGAGGGALAPSARADGSPGTITNVTYTVVTQTTTSASATATVVTTYNNRSDLIISNFANTVPVPNRWNFNRYAYYIGSYYYSGTTQPQTDVSGSVRVIAGGT